MQTYVLSFNIRINSNDYVIKTFHYFFKVCSNGTRVFVQKSILNKFLEKLVSRTKAMKVGDPFAEDTTVGATISRQQADKVLKYVGIAKKEVKLYFSKL